MKLVITIVHDEDADELVDTLLERGYYVTKLASTGGFLSSGNTTLMIGVQKEVTDEVIKLIKEVCNTRQVSIPQPSPMIGVSDVYVPTPVEVTVGGATIFVVDVDKFEKI